MLTRSHRAGKIANVADTITISQLVGYNLTRVRKALGLSQEQATERLEPYLGARWSKTVYSLAERSYSGKRVRQFTAAEVAAFALAFSVPVSYFFLPPNSEDRPDGAALVSGKVDVSWPRLVATLEDGENRLAYDQRLMELPSGERPMRVYRESEIRQLQEYLEVSDLARRHREERDRAAEGAES